MQAQMNIRYDCQEHVTIDIILIILLYELRKLTEIHDKIEILEIIQIKMTNSVFGI